MALFSPYRSIGLVADRTPVHLQKLGTEHFVYVPLGNFFHVYNISKLRLVCVGRSIPDRINSIGSDSHGEFTFTAAGINIYIHRRQEIVATLSKHRSEVRHIFIFGNRLISVGDDHTMCVWDVQSPMAPPADVIGSIDLPADDSVQCIMHPETHLNKVVVGYSSGSVDIFNIRSLKRVYRLKKCFDCGIICMAQSPAVDVVGFGLANGQIVLHDIKKDLTLWSVSHSVGSVGSIAFRSDGVPWMASCSSSGSLVIWDLNNRQMLSQQCKGHIGAITSSGFLANEPILVTAGIDNRLVVWICDQIDGSVRVLRSRSGHTDSAVQVAFYDQSVLLSCTQSSFRTASLIRDERAAELSHSSIEYLPPIAGFAVSRAKQAQWDNILTYHDNHHVVYSWSYSKLAIGKIAFKCPAASKGPDVAAAVAISSCGNYGIVGCRSGALHKFNMQSGMSRGHFTDVGTAPISAIQHDSIHNFCITASLDGCLRLYDLRKLSLIDRIELGSPIALTVLHLGSGLLGCACDDLAVRLIDLPTRKIVRFFGSHTNRITAMAFGKSGRELITSSADGGIRVFDIPSGAVIDWFRFRRPVTSMTLSLNGDFLCTSHAGHRALFIWANKSYFSSVCLSRRSCVAPKEMNLHTNIHDLNDYMESNDIDESNASDVPSGLEAFESLGLASSNSKPMLSLSTLPATAWMTLSSLNDIKKRNRPKQPVKAANAAPFFLPTLCGLQPKLIIQESAADDDNTGIASKRFRSDAGASKFSALLMNKQYQDATCLLKSLSPSAVDAIIRSLSLDIDNEEEHLQAAVDYFISETKSRLNFEIIQAVLALFLKVYGTTLVDLIPVNTLQELQSELKLGWRHTEDLLHSSSAMLAFFSGIQL